MKEYNWREEREKFRPGFQKQATAAVEPAAPAEEKKKRSFGKLFIFLGIILVAAVAALVVFKFSGSKDSNELLADAAEAHESAVGVVTITVELHNGKKISSPIGTAWAFCENRFATNAHVANGIKDSFKHFVHQSALNMLAEKHGCKTEAELVKKLGTKAEAEYNEMLKQILAMIKDVRSDIIINKSKGKSYSVTHVQIHKDYGRVNTKFNPDVAVLTIAGKHDNYFRIANEKTLYSLKSGDPIAFLGFPMENLDGDNVNIDNPVASMQSGIVVAVSDFEMKDGGKDGNLLLRHNLPATGGASGSPVFNQDGEVVAVLFGINVVGQVKTSGNGQSVVRAPSAAQINFGVRVDLLEGVGSAVPIKEFLQ